MLHDSKNLNKRRAPGIAAPSVGLKKPKATH